MRCVNRQDCRNSSSSRRRILTRPLARWRERIVQTLTCSRPPTTIEKLSLTPRAARKSCRQAHCACCATQRNLAAEKGPSSFDVKLNNVTSVVYQLPFGKGRQYGANMNPVLDAFVGGWELTSINTAHTGMPLDVTYGATGA